jgi:hypothetical protein
VVGWLAGWLSGGVVTGGLCWAKAGSIPQIIAVIVIILKRNLRVKIPITNPRLNLP